MPENDDQRQALIDLVGPLECAVVLPPSLASDSGHPVRAAEPECDQRQFARHSTRSLAAVQYSRALPSLPREHHWQQVYACNLSRTGIQFLHAEQVYPGEQLTIVLPGGHSRAIEIVHCLRLADCCYQVGSKFISTLRAS